MRLTAKKYDKSDVRENSGESRVQFIPHGHKTDLAYAHLSRAQKRLDVRVVLGNSDKAYSHLLKMVISTGNILPYETRALLFDHLSKKTGIPRKYMHSIFNSGRGKEVLLSVILVKSQKMTCCVKAHICSADYMNKLPKAKALLDQIPESILPRELPLSARGSEDRPNV